MGRVDDCKHFNAEEFIKKIKKWRKDKEKLKMKLDAISPLPSSGNNAGIRGSQKSDPTLNQVLRRESILKEIEDIERAEEAYEYAKKQLSPEERKLFEGFFESETPNWKIVSDWQETHYIGSTLVYRERKRILRKIEKTLDKYIGDGR